MKHRASCVPCFQRYLQRLLQILFQRLLLTGGFEALSVSSTVMSTSPFVLLATDIRIKYLITRRARLENVGTCFFFSSVHGFCERDSKCMKHRTTVVSFYAKSNLRTSAIMSRAEYDSWYGVKENKGTDWRHVRLQFRCICILVRVVDSNTCQFQKVF